MCKVVIDTHKENGGDIFLISIILGNCFLLIHTKESLNIIFKPLNEKA